LPWQRNSRRWVEHSPWIANTHGNHPFETDHFDLAFALGAHNPGSSFPPVAFAIEEHVARGPESCRTLYRYAGIITFVVLDVVIEVRSIMKHTPL
jgi:hypothetical protein